MGDDIRLGPWQETLADVTRCDALIVDAPYSRSVHAGNSGLRIRKGLEYECMTSAEVWRYVAHWSWRTRGWIVSITSHDLYPVWRAAMEAYGRYVFAPLPLFDRGMSVRLRGDGPSSWTCWIAVGRPRTKKWAKWGTLPGGYMREPGDERSACTGGKPLGVMRRIVRDYSRPGDLVIDTHAGHGTTLLAAKLEGRRALGAEVSKTAYEAAKERISG